MPEEIAESLSIKPPKGGHTNASMRAMLAVKKRITLPNGDSTMIQAQSVIFDGQVISEAKDLPTDAEIEEHRKAVIARRARQG